MKKHLANIVTCIRIIGSVCILCSSVFSPLFYGIYLICGFTDMIDGTIARKTNAVTTFGCHLDSIADLTFMIAAGIKILPAVYVTNWLCFGIVIVFILKIMAVIWRYRRVHQFMIKHTLMNKVTGLMLFLLPLSLPFADIKYSGGIVCTVAFLSAIEELRTVAFDKI